MIRKSKYQVWVKSWNKYLWRTWLRNQTLMKCDWTLLGNWWEKTHGSHLWVFIWSWVCCFDYEGLTSEWNKGEREKERGKDWHLWSIVHVSGILLDTLDLSHVISWKFGEVGLILMYILEMKKLRSKEVKKFYRV